MAVWGFLKNDKGHAWKEGGKDVSSFDDGLDYQPGEEGFTMEAALAKATQLGVGVSPYFIATPRWSERIEAEQAAEEAARIEAGGEDGLVQE